MTSLHRHLTAAGTHATLGFHPDCPICVTERQLGEHAAGTIGKRTAVAATVATMLIGPGALASIAHAAADEQDSLSEGTSDTGQNGEEDDNALVLDAPESGEDSAVVDEEPEDSGAEVDPIDDGPDVTFGAEADPEPQATAPAPPTAPPVVQPKAVVSPPAPKPAAAPKLQTPPAPSAAKPQGSSEATARTANQRNIDVQAKRMVRTARAADRRSVGHAERRLRANAKRPPAQARTAAAPSILASPTIAPKRSTTTASSSAADRGSSTAKGHKRHRVRAGESLWSIAQDRLGDSSPEQVARYVQQLWTINTDRISSGTPGQLEVGAVLLLP